MIVAGAITEPGFGSLALLRAQCLGHLGFQRRLQRRLHRPAEKIGVVLQNRFQIDDLSLTFCPGHGVPLAKGLVTSNITRIPWPTGIRRFCGTSRTLPLYCPALEIPPASTGIWRAWEKRGRTMSQHNSLYD